MKLEHTMRFFTFLMFFLHFSFSEIKSQQIIWSKLYGGYTNQGTHKSILVKDEDAFVMVGNNSGTGPHVSYNYGLTDIWVTKVNGEGAVIWETSLGGSRHDLATSIIETSDKGYLVIGYTSSNDGLVAGYHGPNFPLYDMWMVKLNAKGQINWSRTFGGTDDDEPFSIIELKEGGYLLAGKAMSTDGNFAGCSLNGSIVLLNLSTDGKLNWQQCIETPSNDYYSYDGYRDTHFPIRIVQGLNNDIYMSVASNYKTAFSGDRTCKHRGVNAWILAFNQTGMLKNARCYGGSQNDVINSLIVNTSGNLIFGGHTNSSDKDLQRGFGNTDGWIGEVDSNLEILWSKAIGGLNDDTFFEVMESRFQEGYWLAGASFSKDKFVPVNKGERDMLFTFVRKNDLQLTDLRTFGGAGRDEARSIIEDKEGNIIASGFTYSNNGDIVGSIGYADSWSVKYKPEFLPIISNNVEEGWLPNLEIDAISPNPAQNVVNIDISVASQNNINYRIYNILGQEVWAKQIIGTGKLSETVSLNHFTSGLYVLVVQSGGVKVAKSFVVLK